MADRELTEEELEGLGPSDASHYRTKGRLGDGFSPEPEESTKVARDVAFGSSESEPEPDPVPFRPEPEATPETTPEPEEE